MNAAGKKNRQRIIRAAAIALVFWAALSGGALAAQDFGFGFDDDDAAANTAAVPELAVKIGGEITAEFLGFVHDFKSSEKIKKTSFGDIVSGSLNFSAAGANAEAYIGLNLSAAAFAGLAETDIFQTPLLLDEAYLRVYAGPVSIQAGLRKLTWGKADSLGPLDVINPLDYSDLTNITDIMAIKIARPLVHAAWNIDGFSKLEAVFIPNFSGHRFAREGRWTPAEIPAITNTVVTEMSSRAGELKPEIISVLRKLMPAFTAKSTEFLSAGSNTTGLEYFQTGLRFTTTIGPADIGAQYFYGNFFRPSYFIKGGIDTLITELNSKLDSESSSLDALDFTKISFIKYNRYHQFGIDYAQVLAGFNIRSELAFHLTEDISGDNGAIQNPFIAWSLGFDRNLFWGITANIQCNETIRLLDNKTGNNPILDFEADTPVTSTRFTAQISKTFLRDNLESKVTAIWDVENSDCYIIPAIVWTIRDFRAELSAGVFAGKSDGELGQYWENSFVRAGISYSF